MKFLSTAALVALLAGPALAAEPATGDEIRASIIGNTVEGGMADGAAYAEFYTQEGDIKAEGYSGTWTIEGDEMCFDYGEGADCFGVAIDGASVTWMSGGETAGTGTIAEGNPNDF